MYAVRYYSSGKVPGKEEAIMAQVIIRTHGTDVAHEFAHNSDAIAYKAEAEEQGFKAFLRPDPEVGMGVTLRYPQDTYPYVITRVSPSGKTIWVKPLEGVSKATGHSPARYDGPYPVWSHTYTAEELVSMVRADAPERRVNKVKHGWASHGTPYSIGKATFHRNYSL